MGYFTEQVRQQAKNDIDSALGSLITSLERGDTQLYESALALSNQIVPRKNLKKTGLSGKADQQLSEFLLQLEEKHLSMLNFLDHLEQGDSYFGKGIWMRAQEHYHQAQQLHQPSFRLSREQLDHKVELCFHAIQFNYHNDLGLECLNSGVWQKAISHFKQAGNHCVEGLPYMAKMMENNIQIAKNGILYERHIDMALGLQSQRRWVQAKAEFQKAASLYNDGFEPTLEDVNEAIKACDEHKQVRHHAETEESFLEAEEAKSDYSKIIFPLMLAVLGFIFLFFFTSSPDPETALIDSLSEMSVPSTPVETVIEDVPESTEESNAYLMDSLILTEEEINETEESLSDIDYTLAQLPQIAETQALMLEAEMADIEDEDRAIEIVEDFEDEDEDEDSDNETILNANGDTENANNTDVSTLTHTANRIAVVPFCTSDEDETLAKKLFLDASFELRNAVAGNMSPISRNAVKRGMTKLGISDNLTCSKIHTVRIAREIQASQIIMGSVETLEDERIQLTLRILDPVNRTFKGEITMTDDNMQNLREKLRHEIANLLSKGL